MIRVKTLVRHDGKVLRRGDSFCADGATEKRLITLGVAEFCDGMGVPTIDLPPVIEVAFEGDDPVAAYGEIDLPEDGPLSREELEEEYRELGGQPRSDWSLEKLTSKLEERRA